MSRVEVEVEVLGTFVILYHDIIRQDELYIPTSSSACMQYNRKCCDVLYTNSLLIQPSLLL
jgi:hypothetical protein